jgi:hypothetical protein
VGSRAGFAELAINVSMGHGPRKTTKRQFSGSDLGARLYLERISSRNTFSNSLVSLVSMNMKLSI